MAMMTNDAIGWLLGALVGLMLGAFFFGGLWWTIHRALVSERPALWHVASLLLRTGVVLAGFYWIGGSSWQRLLACLGGFVLARMLVMRSTRSAKNRRCNAEGTGDATQP